MGDSVSEPLEDRASTGGCNLYIFVKKVNKNNKTYYYLVIEEYDPVTKRKKPILHLSLRKILERYVDSEKLGGAPLGWCGGWDLNPRRPTPSGPKPDPPARLDNTRVSQSNNVSQGVLKQRLGTGLSQRLLAEFRRWCLQHSSEETCAQYSRKLQEIDRGERDVGSSRWHITAYKRFSRFLCEAKNIARACEEFRRVKSKRSRPDLYVPPDSEVKRALAAPEPLGYFYYVLAQSGLRAIEAMRLLEDPPECVDLGGYYRCPVLWARGSKRALWAYLIEPPRPLATTIDELEDARSSLKLVGFKYMRKWVATKMLLAGMSEAAVDFAQGRVPETVLRKHYADRLALTDKEYKKYAAWLRRWLSQAFP